MWKYLKTRYASIRSSISKGINCYVLDVNGEMSLLQLANESQNEKEREFCSVGTLHWRDKKTEHYITKWKSIRKETGMWFALA